MFVYQIKELHNEKDVLHGEIYQETNSRKKNWKIIYKDWRLKSSISRYHTITSLQGRRTATLDERFIKLRTATNLSMSNPKRLGLALPIWLISINHRRHSVFNLFTFLFVLMNQIIKHRNLIRTAFFATLLFVLKEDN